MVKSQQFEAIAVLSVGSELVRFTIFSMTDGHELSTSSRSLNLIMGGLPLWDDHQCEGALRAMAAKEGWTKDKLECEIKSRAPRFPGMKEGHVEQDPEVIWHAVGKVIGEAVNMLCQNGMPMTYIKSLAVTTEMSTLVAWDVATGKHLHNAVHWTDSRMGGCGRTGAAVEWLLRRSAGVRACTGTECLMGTMDAWLVWKLTAGKVYMTDVTNASYTGLLDLTTLDWDRDALLAHGLPKHAWPEVRRPDDCHNGRCLATVVLVGRLHGLSVNSTMAWPSATLYSYSSSTHRSLVAVTVANSSVVALGAIDGPLPPPRDQQRPDGLTTVVGYCEPNPADPARPRVVYATLMVSTATQVICWLRDNVSLIASSDECMNVFSSGRPAAGLNRLPSVVPAANKDAYHTVTGLSAVMGGRHVAVAAVDAICYTVADMVRCIAHVSGARRADTVFVDGKYARYDTVLARLADVCDCPVIRRRTDMAMSGAARMVVTAFNTPYKDIYFEMEITPVCSPEERQRDLEQWDKAMSRCYGWPSADDPERDDHDLGKNRGAAPAGLFRRIGNVLSTLVNEVVFRYKTFVFVGTSAKYRTPNGYYT